LEPATVLPIPTEGCANGTITLLIFGDAGLEYIIETSTNLMDWGTVFTTNAPAMPFRWSDTAATSPATFYRALLNP